MRYIHKTFLFVSMIMCCMFQFLRGQFESSTTLQDWALLNHVFTSINFTTLMGCFLECTMVSQCYSLNFYPSNGLCELSKATNISHPDDFRPVMNAVYLEYKKMLICSDIQNCVQGMHCIIKQDERICKDCGSALGMEDGRIPDSAIKSSSNYHNVIGEQYYARLNFLNSWPPRYKRTGEWLQVGLRQDTVITKVATQGKPVEAQPKWISKYTITSSMDEQVWNEYKENGVVKVFNGNVDRDSVVTNSFKESFLARYVRLVVQEWYDWPELRMELYGCPL